MGIGNDLPRVAARTRRTSPTNARRRSSVRSSFNWQSARLWRSPLLKNCGYFVGVLLLFVWNWQLILATAAGIGSMLSIYRLQGSDWQSYKVKWQDFWDNCDRRLTVAIASGGLGTLIAYTAVEILNDTENPWLAFGAIVQGLATLTTLLIVVWQIWGRQERQDRDQFDALLTDLAADSQLKCLIAVRKAIRLVERESLSASQRGELLEYFRLLLSSQDSPTMRAAILDGLAVLEIERVIDLRDSNISNDSRPPIEAQYNSHPLEMPIEIKVTQADG